jgi:hypothetical protein
MDARYDIRPPEHGFYGGLLRSFLGRRARRIAAILASPEASGLDAFARQLAFRTSLSAEQAIDCIRVSRQALGWDQP